MKLEQFGVKELTVEEQLQVNGGGWLADAWDWVSNAAEDVWDWVCRHRVPGGPGILF